MKIVVMIPAYNEEEGIEATIKKIPRKIEGADCVEVIVVDDGSTDRTVEIAKESGADEIILHPINKGLGTSFRDGLKASLEKGADILVTIDADGQFNPDDIPKLIEPILNSEADFVTTSRFLDKKLEPDMPKIKKFGNKLFTKIINILTNGEFTDTQCGFRAYSKKAALKLNLSGNFTYTQEVFIDLVEKGLHVKEIPLKVKYGDIRDSRVVKNPISYGIRALMIIIKTIRDYEPLKFFGIPGVFVFITGFLGGSFMLIRYILTGRTTPFSSLIMFSELLMILGFLIIVLALIADMNDRQRKIQEEILYYNKLKRYSKEDEKK